MSSTDIYTVVGGGAIGGTLAFSLARAGHRVRLVDTDAAHVAAVRAHGLTVARGEHRESVRVEAVTPEECDATLGRVLLAVKAQATGAALDWIEPRLAPDGWVVSLQNGFNEEPIAQRIGAGRTVAAFVNIFADVVEPGVIMDGGAGALVIGERRGAPVSDRVRSLVDDLRSWGPAVADDNVEGYLWAKAGFGAMLAATALADAPMAELIDRHPATMAAVAAEVFSVADALGVTLEAFDAFEPHAFLRDASEETRRAATARLTAWLRTQAKDRSGIWRDLAVRRRPVEVTTHYAEVFAEAGRHGVATPVLRAVITQLRELERDPGLMTGPGWTPWTGWPPAAGARSATWPPPARSRRPPYGTGWRPTARRWSPTWPSTPPRRVPATTSKRSTPASPGYATGSTVPWAPRRTRRYGPARRPATSWSAATRGPAPAPSCCWATTTRSGPPAPWPTGPSGATATGSPAPASST